MRYLRASLAVFLIVFAFGCASSTMMPKTAEKPATTAEYNSIINFYKSIKLDTMTVSDVKTVTGIDLNSGQDITILGPTYVRNFFMKNSLIKMKDLPNRVAQCIRSDECVGYLIQKRFHSSEGIGSFWARWFRFNRKDLIKEWKIEIMILANGPDQRIVYKEILMALPEQSEIKTKKQPLGPIQNVFGDAQYKYRF